MKKVALSLFCSVLSFNSYAVQFAGAEVEFADNYSMDTLDYFERHSRIPRDSNMLADIGIVKIKFTDVQRETRGWLFGAESEYKMFRGFELYFEYDVLVDEKLMEANAYTFGEDHLSFDELFATIQEGTENSEMLSGSFLGNYTLDTVNRKIYEKRKKDYQGFVRGLFMSPLSKYNCVRTQIDVKYGSDNSWELESEQARADFIEEIKASYCSFHFSSEN